MDIIRECIICDVCFVYILMCMNVYCALCGRTEYGTYCISMCVYIWAAMTVPHTACMWGRSLAGQTYIYSVYDYHHAISVFIKHAENVGGRVHACVTLRSSWTVVHQGIRASGNLI